MQTLPFIQRAKEQNHRADPRVPMTSRSRIRSRDGCRPPSTAPLPLPRSRSHSHGVLIIANNQHMRPPPPLLQLGSLGSLAIARKLISPHEYSLFAPAIFSMSLLRGFGVAGDGKFAWEKFCAVAYATREIDKWGRVVVG